MIYSKVLSSMARGKKSRYRYDSSSSEYCILFDRVGCETLSKMACLLAIAAILLALDRQETLL